MFDKYKGFIEIVAVIFTVFFAIYQLRSSAEDFDEIVSRMEGIIRSAEESKVSLKQVEKSLTDLPDKINTFSISIDSLNTIVSKQRDQLSNTLEGFNSSIEGFQNSVDAMAERFNRQPKLKIDIRKEENDTTVYVDRIIITNLGNLLANIYMIRFQIEEEYLISFELQYSRETHKQDNMLSYQIDYEDQYIFPNERRPLILDCKINIRKGLKSAFVVFIYYTAPFGNDGDDFAEFLFKPSN